jgi:excisionase family DNA binding protein
MLSMSQAAKQVGVSKATIHRAIKGGKLSATRLDDGSYEIDPAELFRAYPPAKRVETVTSRQLATPNETGNPPEIRLLEAELRMLRERLDELKEERDAWRQQAERLALTGPPSKKGLFSWGRKN